MFDFAKYQESKRNEKFNKDDYERFAALHHDKVRLFMED